MQDLRLGVVGLGVRSEIAAFAHRPGEGARIVAACDVVPERLARAAERWPEARVTRDAGELRDAGLDAVLVLTPDHTHADLAEAFLEAGVAAYVEKPLAITAEDCDRVLEAARRSGARLFVGHNLRHAPFVMAMRDLIARGAIGEVKAVWCRHFVGHGGDFYFRDWHASRRNTTSLLLQKGAHDIDVIHWLAGAYTARTTAMGDLLVYGQIEQRREAGAELMTAWFDPARNWPPLATPALNSVVDVEDVSMVNLRLENGVLASYLQCHFAPDYWRNYTVIGTEGRLENFGDLDGAVVKVWSRRSDYRTDADSVVEVPTGRSRHGGADAAIVDEFLRFVRDGGPTLGSPVAARQAVAAGCAATASLRQGGAPVDVAPLAPPLAAYFDGGQAPGGRPEALGLSARTSAPQQGEQP